MRSELLAHLKKLSVLPEDPSGTTSRVGTKTMELIVREKRTRLPKATE